MMTIVKTSIKSTIKTIDDKSIIVLKWLKIQTQVICFDELDYSRKEIELII